MKAHRWMVVAVVAWSVLASASAAPGQSTAAAPDPVSHTTADLSVAEGSEPAGNAYCPVTTDEEVDPNFFTVYQGRKVYLCCKKCRTKFEADPEAYVSNLPPRLTPVALREGAEPAHAEPDAHAEDEEHSHDEADEHDQSASSDHEHDEREHDHEHDHSAHAENASGLTKALSYIGRFHVLVIHFPIVLLLFAALFELVSMFGGGAPARSVVRACSGFGALAAVVAASLGLMDSIGADYEGVLSDVLWWHRLLGLTTAGLAILAWLAVERRVRKPSTHTLRAARIAVFLAAGFVGITGHLGGSLIFGWGYFLP